MERNGNCVWACVFSSATAYKGDWRYKCICPSCAMRRREKDFRGNWSLENGNGESALNCIQFPVGISTSDASLRLWSESWEGLKTHPESRLTSVGSMPALVNLQELLSRTGETETPPSEKDPCRHDFPTLFQRTQGFSSRWGGRRGRQVGGVFNYIKRQKGRKVEKWFGQKWQTAQNVCSRGKEEKKNPIHCQCTDT